MFSISFYIFLFFSTQLSHVYTSWVSISIFYVFPRTVRHVCYTHTTILLSAVAYDGLDITRIGTLRLSSRRPVVAIYTRLY